MKITPHWLMALGLALALNSCTTKGQDSELEINKLVPPSTTEALDAGGGVTCDTYSTTTAEIPVQTFNTASDFKLGVVITNNLSNNANLTLGRLNTNDFNATEALITYEATDGSVINIPQQVTPTQGVIVAGGTGVVGAVLIPAAVAAQLAGVTAVRLHVQVQGQLLDGTTITTNTYMPIAIPTSSTQDSSACIQGT